MARRSTQTDHERQNLDMALFRRREASTSVSAIYDFWTWWRADGEAVVTEALNAGDLGRLARVLSKRVNRISRELDWETAPGKVATHSLRLSAGGLPDLRPFAHRWLRAAPAANDTWEFAASRQRLPVKDMQLLELDGHSIDPRQLRFEVQVDETRHWLDLDVFHPAFAEMSRGLAMHMTSLCLEWILGEQDVARWIRSFTTTPTAVKAGKDVLQLRALVEEVAVDPGEAGWAVAVFTYSDQTRGVGRYRFGSRWVDHPTFDLHSELKIRYTAESGIGQPTNTDTARWSDLEQDLVRALGDRGLHLGHLYWMGTLTMHFYSDSQDQNVTDLIQSWVRENGIDSVKQSYDPRWLQVQELRG